MFGCPSQTVSSNLNIRFNSPKREQINLLVAVRLLRADSLIAVAHNDPLAFQRTPQKLFSERLHSVRNVF